MNQSRYLRIINAASTIVKESGLPYLTREAIAARAEVAPGLVSHYLGTMDALVDTIMQLAIEAKDIPLLSRGLAVGYSTALAAPPELRRKAMRYLTEQVMGE